MMEPIIDRPFELAESRRPGAGAWIDRIRINAISRTRFDGQEYIVKTRRRSTRAILRTANLFFRLARNPASVLVGTEAWQRWEVKSFRLLHGDRFEVRAEAPRSVLLEKMPGISLADHLEAGTFTDEMLDAAGAELRRAHVLQCPEFGGGWSHGDANLANFVYDPVENCTRLVDFELVHDFGMPAEQRHAEDLLVFTQDLLGSLPAQRWLGAVLRFLDAYGRPEITRLVRERLVLPRGVPWLWWKIRCNYLRGAELRARIETLRRALR